MNAFTAIPEGEEIAGVVTPVAPRRSMKWGVLAAAAVGLATVGYVSTKGSSTATALDEIPSDPMATPGAIDADSEPAQDMTWMERDDVKRVSSEKVVYADMSDDDIVTLFKEFQVGFFGGVVWWWWV